MSSMCTKPGCAQPANAALTYDYSASKVWLFAAGGSDSGDGIRHALCSPHADRFAVPQGWSLVDERASVELLLSVGLPGA